MAQARFSHCTVTGGCHQTWLENFRGKSSAGDSSTRHVTDYQRVKGRSLFYWVSLIFGVPDWVSNHIMNCPQESAEIGLFPSTKSAKSIESNSGSKSHWESHWIPTIASRKEGKAWASDHGCSFDLLGGAFCPLGPESWSKKPRAFGRKNVARLWSARNMVVLDGFGSFGSNKCCVSMGFTMLHLVSPFQSYSIYCSWVVSRDCCTHHFSGLGTGAPNNHPLIAQTRRTTEVEKTDEIKTMFERPWKAVTRVPQGIPEVKDGHRIPAWQRTSTTCNWMVWTQERS